MSNIKSSKKHAIQSKKNNQFNKSRKSLLRTLIKKVDIAIIQKNKILAQESWKILQPILDRFATKKIIHKNKASRCKSRLYLKIKKIP
ncbi:30S ribosomal protein S20 [Buchnera aphidicola]|uniref:30S ribosomal protein S20 n=1 Tax=Buchnera aphidicola TaxID=9 RepID=UPI00346484FF